MAADSGCGLPEQSPDLFCNERAVSGQERLVPERKIKVPTSAAEGQSIVGLAERSQVAVPQEKSYLKMPCEAPVHPRDQPKGNESAAGSSLVGGGGPAGNNGLSGDDGSTGGSGPSGDGGSAGGRSAGDDGASVLATKKTQSEGPKPPPAQRLASEAKPAHGSLFEGRPRRERKVPFHRRQSRGGTGGLLTAAVKGQKIEVPGTAAAPGAGVAVGGTAAGGKGAATDQEDQREWPSVGTEICYMSYGEKLVR